MLRRIVLVLGILLLIFVFGFEHNISNAQIANAPLILTINGDYSTWTGPGAALEQRTQWGYNKVPQLSPDGKWIAYKSTAKVAIEALKAFGSPGGGGDLPATIWILEVKSNDAERIADQPADASIFNPKKGDKYILRSDPTWSPDGQYIAWTEMPINSKTTTAIGSLVVYSVADKTTKTLVEQLPPQGNYEGYVPIEVKWGASGLAVNVLYVESGGNGLTSGGSIYVYDTQGQLISNTEGIPNLSDFVWIQDASTEYIGLIKEADGGITWELLDPISGKSVDSKGTPELYSTIEPHRIGIYPLQMKPLANWVVTDYGAPSPQPMSIPAKFSTARLNNMLTISDDGASIAFINDNQVTVTDLKNSYVASSGTQVEAIAWSPTAWRIHYGPPGTK